VKCDHGTTGGGRDTQYVLSAALPGCMTLDLGLSVSRPARPVLYRRYRNDLTPDRRADNVAAAAKRVDRTAVDAALLTASESDGSAI